MVFLPDFAVRMFNELKYITVALQMCVVYETSVVFVAFRTSRVSDCDNVSCAKVKRELKSRVFGAGDVSCGGGRQAGEQVLD